MIDVNQNISTHNSILTMFNYLINHNSVNLNFTSCISLSWFDVENIMYP